MRKLPDDFPPIEEQALPWPAKIDQPTEDERRAFTKTRLEYGDLIKRDFHATMTPTVKLVADYLLECVNSETMRCFPSYRTILETLATIGKTEKTVQRAVEALRNRGWLYAWRPDRNKSNHFVFLANEKVVAQILDHQDQMRRRRTEDREERQEHERTLMSGRELPNRPQMSVREQTPMSGKSFNVIHELGFGIEEGSTPLEVNVYARTSQGDEANIPFDRPDSEEDAERQVSEILAAFEVAETPALRITLKIRLLEGVLTPARAKEILERKHEPMGTPKQEAA